MDRRKSTAPIILQPNHQNPHNILSAQNRLIENIILEASLDPTLSIPFPIKDRTIIPGNKNDHTNFYVGNRW